MDAYEGKGVYVHQESNKHEASTGNRLYLERYEQPMLISLFTKRKALLWRSHWCEINVGELQYMQARWDRFCRERFESYLVFPLATKYRACSDLDVPSLLCCRRVAPFRTSRRTIFLPMSKTLSLSTTALKNARHGHRDDPEVVTE